MDRTELKKELDTLHIPEFWYSLDGEMTPNRSVLQKGGGKRGYWVIYGIDERGNKSDFREFLYEEEACEYFYQMMKKEKEIEEKIKNIQSNLSFSQEEERTFIVSNTGEATINNENKNK